MRKVVVYLLKELCFCSPFDRGSVLPYSRSTSNVKAISRRFCDELGVRGFLNLRVRDMVDIMLWVRGSVAKSMARARYCLIELIIHERPIRICRAVACDDVDKLYPKFKSEKERHSP